MRQCDIEGIDADLCYRKAIDGIDTMAVLYNDLDSRMNQLSRNIYIILDARIYIYISFCVHQR